ncbi:hypothetical protein Tco_0401014 [Tanacetum coccineum]
MNNKKHIANLEYFREMLQICPKLLDQQFEELPFEEKILMFLKDLGHNREIKVITDVNVNKLHQPWRSFVAVINKCMSEDFVYQLENKNVKRSNEMYYPCFTKVISRHEDTQLYGVILPNELTNEAIKDSESYKEYYAVALGAEPLKTKASVKKKQARSHKAAKAPQGKRLKATAKVTKPSNKKLPTQGLGTLSEVPLTEEEQMIIVTKRSLTQFHSSYASRSGKSSSDEHDDAQNKNDDDDDADNQDDDVSTHDEEDKEEEGSDLRVQAHSHYESTDDEESDKVTHGANVEGEELDEEETNKEDEANELYRDVNVNLEGRDTEMTDAPRTIIQPTQVIEDTHVIITPVNPEGQQQSSSVSSGFISNMLNPNPDTVLLSTTTIPPPPIPLIPHSQQTPIPTPTTVPSSSLQDLPNFGSLFGFDHRLKTLETDFLEFKQTNKFTVAVSLIPSIVDAYLANKMHEAVKTSKTVNEQLKAEVLTRSSNESKTSHVLAANLSELELKKILIDKMESNKSIHIYDEQKNLYKALVDAYESEKLILDMYRDTVSFKRCRDDEDKDEEPSAGSNRGSKRRRARKEPKSTSVPKEKTSKTIDKSTEGSKSHHKSAGESAQAEEPMHTAKDLEEPAH